MTPSSVLVGFAAEDITPASGYERHEPDGSRVEIRGVHIPLRARVSVLHQGDQSLLVASLDLGTLAPWWEARFRSSVAAALAIDPATVLISCTHTHSSPLGGVVFGATPDDAYLDFVQDRLIAACLRANDDLRRATLKFGECKTAGVAFNRRPVFSGEEVATQANVCDPGFATEFLGFESEPDPTLQILVAVAEDESVLGGLVAFACHPHIMGVEPVHSADLAGAVADELKEVTGATFLFLQGASGDVAWQDLEKPVDWWPSRWGERPRPALIAPGVTESAPWNPVARVRALTAELVGFARRALADAVPLTNTRLRSAFTVLDIPHRTVAPADVAAAYSFLADPTADADEYNRVATGHRYTFGDNRVLQEAFARETIALAALHDLGGPAASVASVTVRCHTIGDVGVAAFPAEMFNEFAQTVKRSSRFPFTVVCGLANGNYGYVPTRTAFDHGGYETRLAMTSKLDSSAGDRMTEAALRLLSGLRSD